MNSLSLDSAQRIFIVSLCALSLSALGEMLAVQAYVMAKWLLCCAARGLVGSLAQSTVMLGLFFFVLSLLTRTSLSCAWACRCCSAGCRPCLRATY